MTWLIKVYEYIQHHPECTRAEIEHHYRKCTHTNEILHKLIDSGKIGYVKTLNVTTGRINYYYSAKEEC